jgi:hypothetical protein
MLQGIHISNDTTTDAITSALLLYDSVALVSDRLLFLHGLHITTLTLTQLLHASLLACIHILMYSCEHLQLRNIVPCALCGLSVQVNLTADNMLELVATGMAILQPLQRMR